MKTTLMPHLFLATLSFAIMLILNSNAYAANPSDPQEKQISMVIEPAGNQLKVFLTGSKSGEVKLKDATVEAFGFINGQKKALNVQRQTDVKSKKAYYLIDKVEPGMRNMKFNVRAGNISESFDLPNLDF